MEFPGETSFRFFSAHLFRVMGVLGPDYRTLLLISFRFVSLFAIFAPGLTTGMGGQANAKRRGRKM
jgi:hypothetical protein